jgi:hypothetical protein
LRKTTLVKEKSRGFFWREGEFPLALFFRYGKIFPP